MQDGQHHCMMIDYEQANQDNDTTEGNNQSLLMKLFPERAIKAAAFVDLMNTSTLDKNKLRIRNPMKKLA